MIVGVDGLSKSAKSKFIDMFIEKYPETIRFRGAGAVNVGIQSRWQEYNFWMHNIIEQLDKLNNSKNIILWDRFLTDSVYSEDKLYSSEILRAMKSHSNKCVVYIDVPLDVLKHRGSKEGNDVHLHRDNYKNAIKSFDTFLIKMPTIDMEISTDQMSDIDKNCYITDTHITDAYDYIQSKMKK